LGRPLFIRRVKSRAPPTSQGNALARRDRDDPTDLEELTTWTSRIVVFGGLAVGIIVIGLVVLAVWAFSGTPT